MPKYQIKGLAFLSFAYSIDSIVTYIELTLLTSIFQLYKEEKQLNKKPLCLKWPGV